jgi:pimeloyl-ACP methyl ester carboxylesterase
MSKPVILSLSGWAQKPSSLQPALSSFSSSHQIINFNYSNFSSIEDCFNDLKKLSITPQIIAGWSLGGQIAIRLIANHIFNPKSLILFSTPFQFVKSPKIAAAMSESSFNNFRENFITNSLTTLEKFSLLMMVGNPKRIKELSQDLDLSNVNYSNLIFWLDELKRFSCHDINFTQFPKTIIFQGDGDVVVNALQAKIFAEKIKNSELKILANCGHCPHISNIDEIQKALATNPHFL